MEAAEPIGRPGYAAAEAPVITRREKLEGSLKALDRKPGDIKTVILVSEI